MGLKKEFGDEGEIGIIISKFQDLSKKDKINLISYFVDDFKKLHNVTEREIFRKKEIGVPVGVFASDALSSLEAIVKYLKEDLRLKFSKIAKFLNRSNKTIWATYHNAVKKIPSSFDRISTDVMIPVSALSNREFSTLESVVGFIKGFDYTNHEVALMLHLNDRTIWTVYDRFKRKRGMKLGTKK